MIIALGSTSAIKREAVREAFAEHDITILAVDAASGVNAQPVGREETLTGARNRAWAARAVCPQAVCAIGIENGLFLEEDGAWRDVAMVVLLTPDGKEAILCSPSIVMPTACVEEARKRGFATTTAGMILAETSGGDPADPHAFLTGGRMNRKTLLVETLKGVLHDPITEIP